MMKKLLLLSTAIILAAGFISCDDNGKITDPPYENDPEASVWFYKGAIEVEQTDKTVYRETDLVVKLVFNEDRNVANLVMYNARFAGNMPVRLDIVIAGITVAGTDGTYRLTGNGIVPTYNDGVPMEIYTITDLTVNARTGSMELDMMCGTFPVKYSAGGHNPSGEGYGKEGEDFTGSTPEPVTPPSDAVYEGTFTVDIGDDINVGLSFDEYGKCNIVLYNATFTPGLPAGAGMPRMNIEIDGVACGIDDQGTYILTGEDIVPVAMGMEFTQYIVTGLRGTITGDRLQFSMTCGSTQASFDGTVAEPEAGV